MVNSILIVVGKFVSLLSQLTDRGSGSTWPGHITLEINKNFIKNILAKNPRLNVILIAGTNGKTTTGKLIRTILEKEGKNVFQNESGANLLNGIASSLIQHSSMTGNIPYDYAIFEVDENTLPLSLEQIRPNYLILLNLFRDQLDRYGEIDSIAVKWRKALKYISHTTKLILNADDPLVSSLGTDLKNTLLYFGVETNHKTNLGHASDTLYCPRCGSKLEFKSVTFSHLGNWLCSSCKLKRITPNLERSMYYPLPGVYNQYNTHAAVLCAQEIGISKTMIDEALHAFTPAFGRQEKIEVNGKDVQIFLSKNPTSFNESLRTVKKLGARDILFVLNDRIPDGQDVSWIWDVDVEELLNSFQNIIVSGDRVYDMALRLKYASSSKIKSEKLKIKNSLKISNSRSERSRKVKFQIWEDLQNAITQGLKQTPKTETLYILPTYSAMLEVRKILTGKKIL